MTAHKTVLVAAAVVVASFPLQSVAQTASAPSSLAQDVADLRQEVARLRGEIERLKQSLPSKLSDPAPDAAPSALAAVEMVQAQIAEHAQVKVESQSRLPLKIFGTIHSSTFLEDPLLGGVR